MHFFLNCCVSGVAFLCLVSGSYAQDRKFATPVEVKGSDRIVHEQKALKPFETLSIEYVYGDINVDVGEGGDSLDIQLDDNLRQLLCVEEKDGALKLSFRMPGGTPVWTVEASVMIRIKTRALKAFSNKTNGKIKIKGVSGSYFSLVNEANGTVSVTGKVDQLTVVNAANGLVQAEDLVADEASVVTQANGTVRLNARKVRTVNSGRGTVINATQNP